jgi:hypothetical protein
MIKDWVNPFSSFRARILVFATAIVRAQADQQGVSLSTEEEAGDDGAIRSPNHSRLLCPNLF